MRILNKNINSLSFLKKDKKVRGFLQKPNQSDMDITVKFNGNTLKKENLNGEEVLSDTKILYTLPVTVKGNIIKVSKTIIEQCKKIDFKSVIDNISVEDLNFDVITVLLESDKEGFITYVRTGGDISYMELKNLILPLNNITNNSDCFSFVTKEFFNNYSGDDYFAFKLLVYLFYGDISKKFIPSKSTVKIGNLTRFVNHTEFNVTYANSLWKTDISTGGFNVRGHFRFQPIGEGRKDKKLIWIEEFAKTGYNRKATVRNFKNE